VVDGVPGAAVDAALGVTADVDAPEPGPEPAGPGDPVAPAPDFVTSDALAGAFPADAVTVKLGTPAAAVVVAGAADWIAGAGTTGADTTGIGGGGGAVSTTTGAWARAWASPWTTDELG
jgi:hypothetical protein